LLPNLNRKGSTQVSGSVEKLSLPQIQEHPNFQNTGGALLMIYMLHIEESVHTPACISLPLVA
jgi:hypothetical protein